MEGVPAGPSPTVTLLAGHRAAWASGAVGVVVS